jgi:hypothetical protein
MSWKEIGKTKTQVLRSTKTYRTANMDCTDIIATSVRMLHRGAIVTLTGRRRHRLEVCSAAQLRGRHHEPSPPR